jgi:hypothetical protein
MTALGTADGGRRFRTRADAFYVRHDGGAWLRNDLGSFAIRGSGAYELVASLFANLDGEQTLDELCVGLPGDARRSVLRLVDTLWRNGFLKEVLHPPEVAPEWMQRLYPAHLTFLDHHADRPVTRMARVRAQPVACAGDGLALRSLVGALGEFGIARLTVLTTAIGAAGIADVTTQATATDPQLDWHTVVTGDGLELDTLAARPELAGAEHVLLAVDHARAGELAEVQQRLVAGGAAVGVLGRCGDFVVAAPSGHCWGCVHRSVVGTAVGDPAGLAPAVVPATMAALHLVQHLFTRLAGVRIDGDEAICSVEPVAPVVRTHVGRRHPACERHGVQPAAGVAARLDGAVRPDVPAAGDAEELVAASDRIVAVTTAWTDPVVGPLLALGEGEADQLPLSVSTCRLADPAPAAGAPRLRDLACRAVSPREARNQVVLVGLEWAAMRVVRLRGGLPRGHVLAAGWTSAEAGYRALMAASAAIPASGQPRWWPADRAPGSDLREFLSGSLAATGREWTATAVERLPTGAIRATVRTAGGRLAAGVGVDAEHAVDGALLRAVADGQPGAAALALLAPPAQTWAAAVDQLAGEPAVDVTHLLPFLDGDAYLAAVPLPEVAR